MHSKEIAWLLAQAKKERAELESSKEKVSNVQWMVESYDAMLAASARKIANLESQLESA